MLYYSKENDIEWIKIIQWRAYKENAKIPYDKFRRMKVQEWGAKLISTLSKLDAQMLNYKQELLCELKKKIKKYNYL